MENNMHSFKAFNLPPHLSCLNMKLNIHSLNPEHYNPLCYQKQFSSSRRLFGVNTRWTSRLTGVWPSPLRLPDWLLNKTFCCTDENALSCWEQVDNWLSRVSLASRPICVRNRHTFGIRLAKNSRLPAEACPDIQLWCSTVPSQLQSHNKASSWALALNVSRFNSGAQWP